MGAPRPPLGVQPDLGGFVPEIPVMPWPAFPTDLVSIAIVVASQAKGSVLFHDWMYPSRMFFVAKLVSMAARIILCTPSLRMRYNPPALQPSARVGSTNA